MRQATPAQLVRILRKNAAALRQQADQTIPANKGALLRLAAEADERANAIETTGIDPLDRRATP